MEHADDLKPALELANNKQVIRKHRSSGLHIHHSTTPALQSASAACYVSRSLVGPTSPVHHGTNAFILHVAPWAFSSFSKIPWISRSSSSYSICQPPSFMLRSANSPPPPRPL